MDQKILLGLTISEAAEQIKSGELTSVELVKGSLAQIEAHNPTLNAFLTVMGEEAIGEAQRADEAIQRGESWGMLHGIPIGVKDLIDVAGVRTTAGSDFLRENIAESDAEVVERLRAAGAIIIGKTHLHEFAIGATSVNPHYGSIRNPYDTDYSPGGSSGGSAAGVASGMCLAALGSDTGGSVRMPSALCNLTGLRPTTGRISIEGAIPLSWTLDTIGPMAKSAYDAAILFDVLDTHPSSPTGCVGMLERPIDGLRVGFLMDDFIWEKTESAVGVVVREMAQTLAEQGAEIIEMRLPMLNDVLRAAGLISLSDGAVYHRERMESEPERFGEDVRGRLAWATKFSSIDYANARQIGREWRKHLLGLFDEGLDLIALPTAPQAAHKIEDSEGVRAARDLLRFTYPFSLSGLPAISIPCGFTPEGFPIGLQLVGAAEEVLLPVAHQMQLVSDWHTLRPSLES